MLVMRRAKQLHVLDTCPSATHLQTCHVCTCWEESRLQVLVHFIYLALAIVSVVSAHVVVMQVLVLMQFECPICLCTFSNQTGDNDDTNAKQAFAYSLIQNES